MSKLGLTVVLTAAIGVAAVAQQPPPTPIRWTAAGVADPVKAGRTVTVQVTAQIDEGWHLYALEPVPGGPTPTRIAAAPDPPFTLDEKHIDSPEPKRAPDPNFGTETAYYEESATFGLPIKVAPSTPAGDREVEITARFQACTDQICLRPQTATMRVKMRVTR